MGFGEENKEYSLVMLQKKKKIEAYKRRDFEREFQTNRKEWWLI